VRRLALAAALLPAVFIFGSAAYAPAEITFYKDVIPILQNRCQVCHRPGESAPMPLLTYNGTRPWAKAIREVVVSRRMPPWFADPAYGKYANDRSLTPSEISILAAWVDAGAPEGNPAEAPKPPKLPEDWTIGVPDAVIEMPHEFHVPASGTIEYQYIRIPTMFTEDKWVEKVEVRPGNRAVVHHLVVFAREPGAPFLENLRPGIARGLPAPKTRPAANNRAGVFIDTPGAEVLGVYVPGGVVWQLKPGQARLIKAGSDLIFQMHYTTNGTPGADRTRVGVIFAKGPPTERVRSLVVANPYLRIPPRAADFPVEARVTLHENARLVSLFPHMHVRGKAFEYRAIYPNGESEVLLRVPRYDFNWQLTYQLAQELPLPKGTVLECTARYDNSPANPHNPNPDAEVAWGDQTWEEMLAGFMDLAFDPAADPGDLVRPRRAR
jgi:hypothetical protein